MQYQVNIQAIPAILVLDTAQSSIAFEKGRKEAFIDVLKMSSGKELSAFWTNKGVTIDEVSYPYRTWFKIDKEDASDFKEYFKYLLNGVNPYIDVVQF